MDATVRIYWRNVLWGPLTIEHVCKIRMDEDFAHVDTKEKGQVNSYEINLSDVLYVQTTYKIHREKVNECGQK